MGSVETLNQLYYDPKRAGSYGGLKALQRSAKLPKRIVEKWLQKQDTYTLHKPVVRKFKRRSVIVGGLNQQFQADLVDLRGLKKYNNGYGYLVTCIDVFSKYAWAVPVKTKTGQELVTAVQTIFAERRPASLQTDQGTEFLNRKFQKYLRDQNVHFFTTHNSDMKASVVERFNRTLKNKMWRYFTKTNALSYLDVLADLMASYNRSYHTSIKMAPLEVSVHNQEEVWQNLYGGHQLRQKPTLGVGDRVRIALSKQHFKKGYTPAWTEEIFTVSRVLQTTPVTFVLKDYNDEELLGSFYKEELQRVGNKKVYLIEQILDERTRAGRKEFLIKWFGYNNSFNSWIPSSQVSQYGGTGGNIFT